LCLKRIRGARPEDERILPASFLALFGKGSIPEADAAKYPAPPAIRQALDAVHRRTLEELPALAESVLDEPADPPHAMFRTKGGGLEFAAYHEMLHAGQIALLRRLFGHPPLR
jgi:uncharacterized damage-inducible protein DinB